MSTISFAFYLGFCLVRALDLSNTSFILPANDGEAKAIEAILRTNGASDIRVSAQGWGARLDREPPNVFEGLKKNIVIVEMPSPELEEKLRTEGHHVLVIDHHSYQELKRANPKSSIEQIAELLNVKLTKFQKGVAINDRSYIFGLVDSEFKFSNEEIQEIREYDLRAQNYTDAEFETARTAFSRRLKLPHLTVVSTPSSKTGFISDLNVLENREGIRDLLVISHKDSQVTELNFYGSPSLAKKLQSALGGWSGGDESRSMYWGFSIPEGKSLQDFPQLTQTLRVNCRDVFRQVSEIEIK